MGCLFYITAVDTVHVVECAGMFLQMYLFVTPSTLLLLVLTHFFLVFRENAAGCNGAGSQKKSRKPEVALSINVGVFR